MALLNKDNREICRFCQGDGVQKVIPVRLYDLCRYCKGSGLLHWTENLNGSVTQEEVNYDLIQRVAMKNVDLLVQEIKMIFRRFDKEAIVDVKELPNRQDFDPFIYQRPPFLGK